MPLTLSVPVAPVSARVKVAFAESQTPEIKSKGVKPDPLGGTSTIATLFRFVTLRLFNVSEIAVIVPERPLTEAAEPSDAPNVLLTVIPLDEVHVVTLAVVVHEARACADNRRVPKARTTGTSVSNAERNRIAARAWDDMEATSRCMATDDLQRTPLAIDWTTVERSSLEKWIIGLIAFALETRQ